MHCDCTLFDIHCQDKPVWDELMKKAICENKPEFVKFFMEGNNGIPLKEFFTQARILDFYATVSATSYGDYSNETLKLINLDLSIYCNFTKNVGCF